MVSGISWPTLKSGAEAFKAHQSHALNAILIEVRTKNKRKFGKETGIGL
jgi:hypothetical protein